MALYIDNLVSEGIVDHKSWRTQVASTATSASTLTLTATSEAVQVFTGTTSGQILKMPDATTIAIGYRYELRNDSTQNVTVQDFSSGALFLLGAGQRAELINLSTATAAGSWSFTVMAKNATGKEEFAVTYPGTGLAVNYTGGTFRHNGTSTAVAAGTITLPVSTTNGWIYVDIDGVVKATASLPNMAMAMYQFTTSASAVTALSDQREEFEANMVWGVGADIQPVRYNSTQGAGTAEKYARADHTHAATLLLTKAGVIASGTFTGNPKTAAVTFGTAMPSANYSVSIKGIDVRVWSVSSVTTTGFTIQANANQALTGSVYWVATLHGESL